MSRFLPSMPSLIGLPAQTTAICLRATDAVEADPPLSRAADHPDRPGRDFP